MIGDKRKFPIMLIVPEWDVVTKWAARQGITATGRAELLATPAVREKLEQEVASELTELAHFEMPKKFAFLEREFSIESGDLTPTLKVKRRVVEKTYKSLIDSLYATGASA
jgi:long-chain acyl-CoA synthetase